MSSNFIFLILKMKADSDAKISNARHKFSSFFETRNRYQIFIQLAATLVLISSLKSYNVCIVFMVSRSLTYFSGVSVD